MLSQEIERKFTFYFCLPTDVFLVEDALLPTDGSGIRGQA